jgi:hypothetical protein
LTGDLLTPDELDLSLEAVAGHLPSTAEMISSHIDELAERKLWLERGIHDALLILRRLPRTGETERLLWTLRGTLGDA